MPRDESRSRGVRHDWTRSGAATLGWGVVGGLLIGAVPAGGGAPYAAAGVRHAPLVFDHVTVVDVEQGRLVPDQRVVIEGTRIRTMGNAKTVAIPRGARIVPAKGKYLMPGLWDFHSHTHSDIAYPLLIATGVTGFRSASSLVPLDTMRQWRREILAGTRVGPPRQILSGASIDDFKDACEMTTAAHVCVPRGDTAAMLRLVDSLRAAGADMLKLYMMHKPSWFFFAREARRRGLRFGGHLLTGGLDSLPDKRVMDSVENDVRTGESEIESADSGASIVDHSVGPRACLKPDGFEVCRKVAQRAERAELWFVPTLYVGQQGPSARIIAGRFRWWSIRADWTGQLLPWLRDSLRPHRSMADSMGPIAVAHRAGVPLLAGSDVPDFPMSDMITGFASHADLAMAVADGMTPLDALRTATLNPARFLHGIDSLGTVAPGKLADLVLLDADPLADITNTLTIRAVVANGRYYDRPTLDQFLAEYLTKRKQGFRAWRKKGRWMLTIDSSDWAGH